MAQLIPQGAPRALIIGGTRGLGRAYAIRLLAQGVRPIIVGRTAAEASSDPALAGAEFVAADVADAASHGRILDAAFAEAGNPPAQLVWCAGIYHRGPHADMAADAMAQMTATHWLGPVALVGAFHRRMLADAAKRPYDLVVVGSVLAHVPGKQHAVLSGLKAAKVHFARVFSQELSRDLPGSMTLVVNPWAMKTGFFDGAGVKTDGFMDPAFVADVIAAQVENLPRDASRAGRGVWPVEVTLDRGEGGATKTLLGPQPPKC
jgi:hypothetical protein